MRQGRWIAFLGYYDFAIQYQPGRENVVADALSRRKKVHVSQLMIREEKLLGERLETELVFSGKVSHRIDSNDLADEFILTNYGLPSRDSS